jgi:hypothetical protein
MWTVRLYLAGKGLKKHREKFWRNRNAAWHLYDFRRYRLLWGKQTLLTSQLLSWSKVPCWKERGILSIQHLWNQSCERRRNCWKEIKQFLRLNSTTMLSSVGHYDLNDNLVEVKVIFLLDVFKTNFLGAESIFRK